MPADPALLQGQREIRAGAPSAPRSSSPGPSRIGCFGRMQSGGGHRVLPLSRRGRRNQVGRGTAGPPARGPSRPGSTRPTAALPAGTSVRSSSTSVTRPHWSGTRWTGSARSFRTIVWMVIERSVAVTFAATVRPSCSPEIAIGSGAGAHAAAAAMSSTPNQHRARASLNAMRPPASPIWAQLSARDSTGRRAAFARLPMVGVFAHGGESGGRTQDPEDAPP